MSDLLLATASPEFWRTCGYAGATFCVIGVVAVILFPDNKRRLQKALALIFVALLLAGLALTRFGNSALLAEARERASEAERELARVKTPRRLTAEARQRVAAALEKLAGQEFEGQVAPGSDDARPFSQDLNHA